MNESEFRDQLLIKLVGVACDPYQECSFEDESTKVYLDKVEKWIKWAVSWRRTQEKNGRFLRGVAESPTRKAPEEPNIQWPFSHFPAQVYPYGIDPKANPPSLWTHTGDAIQGTDNSPVFNYAELERQVLAQMQLTAPFPRVPWQVVAKQHLENTGFLVTIGDNGTDLVAAKPETSFHQGGTWLVSADVKGFRIADMQALNDALVLAKNARVGDSEQCLRKWEHHVGRRYRRSPSADDIDDDKGPTISVGNLIELCRRQLDSDLVQEYMDIWERGLIWAKTFFVSTANPTGEELQKRITHKMLREFDVPFCQEVCEAWSGDFYKELFDDAAPRTEDGAKSEPPLMLRMKACPPISTRNLIELCKANLSRGYNDKFHGIWERGLKWAEAEPFPDFRLPITFSVLFEFDREFAKEVGDAWEEGHFKSLFEAPEPVAEEPSNEDLEESAAPSTNYRITAEKLIELCEVHIEHYENQGNAANPTECGRFQAIWRLGRDWLKRLHVEGEPRVLTHASLRIHSTQFAQEVCDAWQCGIFDEYFCDPPEELPDAAPEPSGDLEDTTLSLNYQITAEKLIKLCKARIAHYKKQIDPPAAVVGPPPPPWSLWASALGWLESELCQSLVVLTHETLRKYDPQFAEEVAKAWTGNDFDEYFLTGDDRLPDAAPKPSEEMLSASIPVERVYVLCEMHTRHYDLIVRVHHQPEYQKHLSDWEKGIEWVRKQPRNGIVTLRQLRHALPDLPLSVFYEYREGDYPKLTFKTFSIKTTAKEEYEKVETLTIDRLRLIKICSIFVAQYGLRAFSAHAMRHPEFHVVQEQKRAEWVRVFQRAIDQVDQPTVTLFSFGVSDEVFRLCQEWSEREDLPKGIDE